MWKEELRERFMPMAINGETRYLILGVKPNTVEDFISSKFAELIDEIPDQFKYYYPKEPMTDWKQQLRDKWL